MPLEKLNILMHDVFGDGVVRQKCLYSRRKQFSEQCVRQWAIETLFDRCKMGVWPYNSAPVEEYEKITCHFYSEMMSYAKNDEQNAWRFKVAAQVAYELESVLNDIA